MCNPTTRELNGNIFLLPSDQNCWGFVYNKTQCRPSYNEMSTCIHYLRECKNAKDRFKGKS